MTGMEQFTQRAKDAIKLAIDTAAQTGSEAVEVVHLFYGILAQKRGVGGVILARHGLRAEEMLKILLRESKPQRDVDAPPLSAHAKEVIMSAQFLAEKNKCGAGTAHLLYAILLDGSEEICGLLKRQGCAIRELKESCMTEIALLRETCAAERPAAAPAKKELPFLTDLSALAASDAFFPVVGREKEIDELITVLSRKTKHNPCLIGEPGVGKTAIVEGAARKLSKEVWHETGTLRRIMSVDLGAMLAGAKYRGDFEERLCRVLRSAQEQQMILFIDEIHMIVGAGAGENAADAANLMKPYLARGDLQIIGATTAAEYRKYIEKDAALARRFQTIEVCEPSQSDAVNMLCGVKGTLESHHGVTIAYEAVKQAVSLSARYIPTRRLPDKAIDVLDETCSRKRIASKKRLCVSPNTEDALLSALRQNDEAQACKLYREWQRHVTALTAPLTVTAQDVKDTVAQMTGIPSVGEVHSVKEQIDLLRKRLTACIFGQEDAVFAICTALFAKLCGFENDSKIPASFLFLGPTGVGKTACAKEIAACLFPKESVIRLDMSEMSEAHTVSRLIGAPPGYKGYEEGGKLTEAVRRHPYSLVLFDEIDKAHPQVVKLLLQILEDGRLTDAQGETVDFSNTVIILTSNCTSQIKISGFTKQTEQDTREAAEQLFSKELVNRIDSVVLFHTLEEPVLRKIFHAEMEKLAMKCQSIHVALSYDESDLFRLFYAQAGRRFGARAIRRFVTGEVERVLLNALSEEEYADAAQIQVKNEKICAIFKTYALS